MRYWLMKSEPEEFSLEDLRNRPEQTEPWDGVRNYQARNFMRDDMKKGDKVFFYHSNCTEPGIVGIATIAREAYPDPTAFDPDDSHYDPKSDPDNPRWYHVDVRFERALKRTISLKELKDHPEALGGLALIRRGNRLSVMPVDETHWRYILSLE
ncbi:MAG: EVE domain-containing protein [Phycisphaerales bacterium]